MSHRISANAWSLILVCIKIYDGFMHLSSISHKKKLKYVSYWETTYLEMKELHFYHHFLEEEVTELTMFK